MPVLVSQVSWRGSVPVATMTDLDLISVSQVHCDILISLRVDIRLWILKTVPQLLYLEREVRRCTSPSGVQGYLVEIPPRAPQRLGQVWILITWYVFANDVVCDGVVGNIEREMLSSSDEAIVWRSRLDTDLINGVPVSTLAFCIVLVDHYGTKIQSAANTHSICRSSD